MRERKDSPLKSAEHDRRLNHLTVIPREVAVPVIVEAVGDVSAAGAVVPDGEGDEAGEPEEHG